jgi:hypothetical protein
MSQPTEPIFKTCGNGHDLTAEDAYIVNNQGYRACRLCGLGTGKKKRNPFVLRN